MSTAALSDDYVIRDLPLGRADQAFPVVQSSYPRLSVGRWRDYCAAQIVPKKRRGNARGANIVRLPSTDASGVVVAEVAHGYIQGLFGYHIATDLMHGRTLDVDVFVAVNLFDPKAATKALLGEVERIAHLHGCEAVHLSLPETSTPVVAEIVDEFGLRVEGVRLCKSLAEPGWMCGSP